MFDRFPQLKRLERLLNKASPFSPKKKQRTPRSRLADSPIFLSRRWRGSPKKAVKVDNVQPALNAVHLPPAGKRLPAPQGAAYDSDVLMEMRKTPVRESPQPSDYSASVESKRILATPIQSPTEMTRSNRPSALQMRKMAASPLNQRNVRHLNVLKVTGKRPFDRPMQEPQPSDALSVLSDEESDVSDDPERPRPVRYPLPTMPLSIMVPVKNLPWNVVPMDFSSVLARVTRFDSNIESLMENRKRLASSYALFDDLCTSFRGPENLDKFLRSLITNKPISSFYNREETAKKKEVKTPVIAMEIQSRQGPSSGQAGGDHGRMRGRSSAAVNVSESRLFRSTVSSKMKQVAANPRTKRISAGTDVTDSASSAHYFANVSKGRPSVNQRPRARRILNKRHPPPVSEHDSREDLLQRVRCNLMNLPWIGRGRRNSMSHSNQNPQDSLPAASVQVQ